MAYKKKKPHQRTPRQRKKHYALITVPRWVEDRELPTLKLSPRLVLVRPFIAVMVNAEVVAIAPDMARAREWASDNVVVTRKLPSVRTTSRK